LIKKNQTISIVNYGLGNLHSIKNVIAKIGGSATIIDHVSDLKNAEKIILPGIGAFDHGMHFLKQKGWIEALNEAALQKQIPILGICLGMQLMCTQSQEGTLPGLGWFDAQVVKFNMPNGSVNKIPHMGWNAIAVKKPNPLIIDKKEEQRFYFVHSYHVSCNNANDILATATHEYEFVAAISHNNLFATQFHPEKSHRFGMELLTHFLAI
jgi:glutamine amidotransferase